MTRSTTEHTVAKSVADANLAIDDAGARFDTSFIQHLPFAFWVFAVLLAQAQEPNAQKSIEASPDRPGLEHMAVGQLGATARVLEQTKSPADLLWTTPLSDQLLSRAPVVNAELPGNR